jgi:hypothetical protein
MRGVNFARFIEKHGIKKQTCINDSSEQTEDGYTSVLNETGLDVCAYAPNLAEGGAI